jgi:hypothetical protein
MNVTLIMNIASKEEGKEKVIRVRLYRKTEREKERSILFKDADSCQVCVDG